MCTLSICRDYNCTRGYFTGRHLSARMFARSTRPVFAATRSLLLLGTHFRICQKATTALMAHDTFHTFCALNAGTQFDQLLLSKPFALTCCELRRRVRYGGPPWLSERCSVPTPDAGKSDFVFWQTRHGRAWQATSGRRDDEMPRSSCARPACFTSRYIGTRVLIY